MRSIIRKNQIRTDLSELLFDESRYTSGIPKAVFYPESLSDLQKILSDAHADNTTVTFVGAQTGTTGGSTPVEDTVAVCFSSMNKFLSVEWHDKNPVLWCEPGVTLASISEFLSAPLNYCYKIKNSESLGDGKWFYPPDPTEKSAQLGGTVATNASGARSFHFGPTRNHIAALQIALASGDTVTLKRGSDVVSEKAITFRSDSGSSVSIPAFSYESPGVKNAAGYYSRPGMDILDMFIGSEGTLGAFGKIGILLQPSCEFISGLSFFPSREAAFDFADFLRNDKQVVSIEYFDPSSLAFINTHKNVIANAIPDFPIDNGAAILWEFKENNPGSFESKFDEWERILLLCGSSFDKTWSGFDKQDNNRLKIFRHTLPEVINTTIAHNKQHCDRIRKIGTDTALPADCFRKVYMEYIQIVKKSKIPYAAFGHLGDCHIHINLIPESGEMFDRSLDIYHDLMEITIAHGGTVSAEHGIGKLKKDFLLKMYGKEIMSQMCRIKTALDPMWLLNPGNMFERNMC